MKKLLSSSFVMLAGVASLPTATSPWQGIETPAPDYRDDARFHCIRRFFQRYQCPAEQVAETFLEASDRYHLDWRLLPSLSFVESTGGKLARNNNLFGWGSGRAAFDSVTAGIHTVGYRLATSELYRDKSLDELLATYNPDAGYGLKVKSIMARIGRMQAN